MKHVLNTRGAKRYLAVIEGHPEHPQGHIEVPVPASPHKHAETRYRVIRTGETWSLLEAWPYTGRTHQIRAHCAYLGTPIRGDAKYGDPFDIRAPHALLHAHHLTIEGQMYTAPPPAAFSRYLVDGANEARHAALDTRRDLARDASEECYRLFNGNPEGFLGCRIDRYQDWLWVIHHQSQSLGYLRELIDGSSVRGIYYLEAQVDRSRGGQTRPKLIDGEGADQPLIVKESGVRYAVELGSHLSTGLFLDQRPQRAWLAHASQPWGRVLNTFAHAGGFNANAL